MERTPQDVTDKELEVLQFLWDSGRATVRQLTDALYPKGTAAQYATVQKLLERLEDKGCVARDRNHWPHVWEAAVAREELIGLRLRAMADQLCGGSLAPLLLHLIRSEPLSTRERQELRAFLEQLQRPKGERGAGTNNPGPG